MRTPRWCSTGCRWRQVRIEGTVVPVNDAEADAYFHSRAHLKQVGAWASLQSQPLASRTVLEARLAEYAKKYPADQVPPPPHWSGLRVIPNRIEFWSQGDGRLHVRDGYSRTPSGWSHQLLYP